MSEVSCNSMGRDDMASPLVNLVALSLGGGALSGATLSVSCAGPSRLLLCPHPSERLANGSSRGCKRAGADEYSIGGEAAVCIKAARMAPTYLQKRPPPILVSGQDTSPQDTIWHKVSTGACAAAWCSGSKSISTVRLHPLCMVGNGGGKSNGLQCTLLCSCNRHAYHTVWHCCPWTSTLISLTVYTSPATCAKRPRCQQAVKDHLFPHVCASNTTRAHSLLLQWSCTPPLLPFHPQQGSFGDDLSACSSLLDTSSTPHTATSVRRCLEDQPGFIPSCDTTPVTPEARSTSVQGFLGYMEAAALSKHGYSIEVATLLPPAFVLLDGWRARH